MEQLNIDQTVDIYHQARKIAYSCPAFRTEVRFYLLIYLSNFLYFQRMTIEICMNGLKSGQNMI